MHRWPLSFPGEAQLHLSEYVYHLDNLETQRFKQLYRRNVVLSDLGDEAVWINNGRSVRKAFSYIPANTYNNRSASRPYPLRLSSLLAIIISHSASSPMNRLTSPTILSPAKIINVSSISSTPHRPTVSVQMPLLLHLVLFLQSQRFRCRQFQQLFRLHPFMIRLSATTRSSLPRHAPVWSAASLMDSLVWHQNDALADNCNVFVDPHCINETRKRVLFFTIIHHVAAD